MNNAIDISQQNLAAASFSVGTTKFAPADRDTHAEICRKTAAVNSVPLLSQTLNAIPNMVLVLNGNRQIIAANDTFLAVLGATMAEVTEKRPGEAIKCIHASDGPGGCGTGLHCTTCGAVNAILDSVSTGARAVRECRVLVNTVNGAIPLDLRVTATPFHVESDLFILAAIEDISHEKRLSVLQRTFFHDVLNTAGCIQGYVSYLAEGESSDNEVSDRLAGLSNQLIEEIQCQRDLLNAEAGDMETRPVPFKASQILVELRRQYLKHPAAEGRNIVIGTACDSVIITDGRLLSRVLGNMLKNALEAAAPGDAVTIACFDAGDAVLFTVNNTAVMPRDVQLQIFQRSFSTKGDAGRGIGSYSMKLFGERYLGGKVDFVSRQPEGTTFRLRLPKRPPAV